MAHGPAGTITLYDDQGHPVTVELQDGQYRVVVTDTDTHAMLSKIVELLSDIHEMLAIRAEG